MLTEDLYVTNVGSKTKACVVTNFVTEAANTLKTNGFVVANTSPGSLDQFYLAYASDTKFRRTGKLQLKQWIITFFNAYNNDPKTKVLSSCGNCWRLFQALQITCATGVSVQIQ
jgi:hypothetical protein